MPVIANSATAVIDDIAACCARIEQACAGLDDAEWHRPTALPSWDVQDVVAHLASIEAMLIGRLEPFHEPLRVDHVRNPLGALNERLVDRRRSWSGAAVLDELREVTALRITQLRDLSEEDLATKVPSPVGGMVPQSRFLTTRRWDYVLHDLDISEALGRPFPVESSAPRRVLDEMLGLLPRAVAKGGIAEGVTVAVEITEPVPRSAAARVRDGRGHRVDLAAGEATLHLRASPTAFLRVGAGRQSPVDAIASAVVVVDGDRASAAAVLTAINVVP